MTNNDSIAIYNPEKDRIETIHQRKLKKGLMPKVKVQILPRDYDGLDLNDKVRTPILKLLMDRVHEFNPRIDCIRDDRSECHLYDRLVKVSNTVSKEDRKRLLASPETLLLRGEPTDCWLCIFKEHERRKKENKVLRRLGNWLKVKRSQKKD